MKKEKKEICYTVLDCKELSIEDQELVEKAKETLNNSYAPYSHFHVACAVRCESGKIIVGANQENVAYPSGLCAERVALFSAQTLNEMPKTLCIVAKDEHNKEATAYPCGACRQVMMETQKQISKHPLRIIILRKDETALCFENVEYLLPFSFDF